MAHSGRIPGLTEPFSLNARARNARGRFVVRQALRDDHGDLIAWRDHIEHAASAQTLTNVVQAHAAGAVRIYLAARLFTDVAESAGSTVPAGMACLDENYLQYVFLPYAPMDFRRTWPLAEPLLAVAIDAYFTEHDVLRLSELSSRGRELVARLGWPSPRTGSVLTRDYWNARLAPHLSGSLFAPAPR